MFLPDLPISIAFGGLVVASLVPRSRRERWSHQRLSGTSFKQVIGFGVLVHCPDSFAAFVRYPEWNLGYFVPWARVGYAGALLLELILLAVLLLGCKLALLGARRSARALWLPIGAGLVAFGATLALVWNRYLSLGTYEQFHGGKAVLAPTDPDFSRFVSLAGVYLLLPFGILLTTNLLRSGVERRTRGRRKSNP